MATDQLAELVEEAKDYLSLIDTKMAGMSTPGNQARDRIYFGLLNLSLEHFGSIVLLFDHGLSASAAALLRAQYESLIRGIYFRECAKESEIKKYSMGQNPISLRRMIDHIEENPGLGTGVFREFYSNTIQHMHSFTHGGIEQVGRRFSEAGLGNSFKENEVKAMITTSKAMAHIAACCAAAAAEREDIAKQLLPKGVRLDAAP